MSAPGLARRIVTSMIGNAFAPLAALATAPIMAHALGPTGRGEVAAAVAPLALATAAATMGLPVAVTYFVARHPHLARHLLGRAALLTIGVGMLTTAAVVCTAGWLAGGDVGLGQLIALAATALVPGLLAGLLQAVAAGRQRWRLIATERLVTNGSRLVAMGGLAASGHLDVVTCVVILALSPVLGAVVYLPSTLSRAPECGEPDFDTRTLLSYGARVWVGSLSGVVLARIDQTLMTPLAGSAELGLYVVAVSISEIPLIVNSAVRDVVFSSDARQGSSDALTRAARLSTLATGGAAALVALVSWWGIRLLFGSEFHAAWPSCVVLLLAVVVGNPGSLAGVGLSTRGGPGMRSASLAVACLMSIGATILLAGPFGAVGAAVATLIGNVVSGGLNITFMRILHGVRASAFLGVRSGDIVFVKNAVRRRMT